jgi:hypothetical protein
MASMFDPAKVGDDHQDLAQFEPDPDGDGTVECAPDASEGTTDDAQWVVWSDAEGECEWVYEELTLLGVGLLLR